MAILAQDRPANGPYRLAIALMCIAPSTLALFSSWALAQHADFAPSALWFVFEVSFFLGCVGIAIASVMAVVEGIRRQIPAAFPWLMGIFAAIGIFLLWYARHIYANPWAPTT
jgi:hypothetical protein